MIFSDYGEADSFVVFRDKPCSIDLNKLNEFGTEFFEKSFCAGVVCNFFGTRWNVI